MKKQKRKYERRSTPTEGKFYILWSPQSDKPPKIKFTAKKAEEVADVMVKKYGTQFFVMQSVSLHQIGKPERISYTGKEAKQPELKEQILEQVSRSIDPPAPMSNAGAHWSIDQDRYLRRLFNQGMTWAYIATAMGRSKLAIQYRLQHLGLIDKDNLEFQ